MLFIAQLITGFCSFIRISDKIEAIRQLLISEFRTNILLTFVIIYLFWISSIKFIKLGKFYSIKIGPAV